MQAAPKLIGQAPSISAYPRKRTLHPSRQPLPQRLSGRAASGTLCGYLILASLVLAPLALINISIKATVAENGYRIQHISGEIDGAKETLEATRLNNAKLASLERVRTVAAGKLGMTEPTVAARIISLPGQDATSPEYAFLNTKEVR